MKLVKRNNVRNRILGPRGVFRAPLITVFALAVLVPCAALSFLALRAADRESAYVERRLEVSLMAEVDSVARRAGETMEFIASRLERDAGSFWEDPAGTGEFFAPRAASFLSDWMAGNDLVDVPFFIERGELVIPDGMGRDQIENDVKNFFVESFGAFLTGETRIPVYEGLARIYRRNAGDRENLVGSEASSYSLRRPSAVALSPAPVGFDEPDEPEKPEKFNKLKEHKDPENPGEQCEFGALGEIREMEKEATRDAATLKTAPPITAVPQIKNEGMERQIAENLIASDPGAREDAFRQASDEGFEILTRNVAPTSPAAQSAVAAAPLADGRSGTVAMSRSFRELKAESDWGLLPYLSENGLALLFWSRREDSGGEKIIGCSLRVDAVKSTIAGALGGLISDARVLVLLDENGRPVVPDASALSALSETQLDWRRPFAAREISSALPRWEVGAWLIDPGAFESRARLTRIAVWVMVAVLLAVIVLGGAAVIRMLSSELRAASQRTTFVANVSHELKTPLTSIKLFAELLLSGRQADEGRRAEYLRTMISEIDRLSRLVEDVLTFSRRGRGWDAGVENNAERKTGAEKNPVSTVDLAAIAEETISKLQPGLSMRGFDVGFERVRPLPVSGNGEALAQVAMNLLSNAEKYSGDAREITVVCRREGGRALMEVSDRGIGVEPRLAGKIFQEFFRCDDSLSSMGSGAGLGLTIARDIARRHGGDVLYDPREGGGSVFTLSLPIGGRLI